jgi:6-phosphogluconolactonase
MTNLTRYTLQLTIVFAAALFSVAAPGSAAPTGSGDQLVYIGTGAGPKSHGIYVFKFAAATGKLTPLGLAAETTDPGFLAIDPSHRNLYAVNEISNYEGKQLGSVSAFSINHKTGKLTLLNVVESGGSGPTHLVVDKTGKYVLVANYVSGSVAMFPILADGRLGKASAVLPQTGHSINPQRQEGPHAHSVYTSPDNRFAISADLGTDQVYVYRFDAAKGTLAPNQPPFATVAAGSGPRHFAFSTNAKFGYVIQELSWTITAFSYDAQRGALHSLQTVPTLPAGFKVKGGETSAEVVVHPSGKFLYGSNRGDDNSIAVFAIDPAQGTLTHIENVSTEGKTPRSFSLDPTGRYLIAANQDSSTLVVYRVDAATGRLTPTGEKQDAPSPTCVLFEPAQ